MTPLAPEILLDAPRCLKVSSFSDMAWAAPQYSKTRLDAAGETLISPFTPDTPDEDDDDLNLAEQWSDYTFHLEEARAVINNWRSSHSYPLNTFQMGLRGKARDLPSPWLVAQRIKRLPAIALKLQLNKNMKLSQMQDIGGCRAVVSSVKLVDELVKRYKASSMKHELIRATDYIRHPRTTGYRSAHLIYRFHSAKHTEYNGLRIEMQIRSRLQHAWATAVETIGEFVGQALKSNLGTAEWLRFFQVMASAIAIQENTELVPGTANRRSDLVKELRHLVRLLNVEGTLRTFGNIVETREGTTGADLFLIATNPARKSVQVTGFPLRQSEKAMERYSALEKTLAGVDGAQVVLVSVDSIEKLRRAYPSYFLESRVFMMAVKRALQR